MPQGILLEMVLLVLSVLAVVLASVVLLQGRPAALPSRAVKARMAGSGQTGRPVVAGRAAGRLAAGARVERARGAQPVVPLLPSVAAGDLAEGRLATAISALYAIARSEDMAAAKIAERTVPRLQDYSEPVAARLHLARHRLAVLSLGKEPQAARIAAQCLAVLGGE